MIQLFFLFLSLIISFANDSTPTKAPSPCGIYKVKGTLKILPDMPGKVVFVTNAGSQSETRFEFPDPKDFQKIAAHLNQTIEFSAIVKQPIYQMRGKLFALKNIHLTIPNPLVDFGYMQITPLSCQ